jgi:prevent-host-death family protein
MQLTAVEFKAKCLELMDQVNENHEEVIITKYGKALVKLVPVIAVEERGNGSLFGYMKGSVKINGNIIDPIDEMWDAES